MASRFHYACGITIVTLTATLWIYHGDPNIYRNRAYEGEIVAERLTEISPIKRIYSTKDRFLTIYPLDGSEGRLGNFCFRYAAALGIAKRNGMILVLPDNKLVRENLAIFNLTVALESDVPFWNTLSFTDVNEAHWGIFDSRHNNLPAGNIRLNLMYTQSWKYFYEINLQVKQELKIHDSIQGPSDKYVNALKHEQNTTLVIGIHVRRGDFLVPSFQQWGYAVATPEFFNLATSWFVKKYGIDILFLVASDDIPWCKENINFNGAKHAYSINATVMQDFSRLIASDHHIVSVGSFGWWTAWLGNGDVVYYKDFPTPNSAHASNHRSEDYYPPHWVPLP